MNTTENKNVNHIKQVTKVRDNKKELEDSLKWIININDFTIDIRKADRHLQLDALEFGLIPHLPTYDDNS